MEVKDFYRILGVSETASANEIKRAYRDLAKRYHPDANPDDAEAESRFKNISEAYDVLKDGEKRRKYDQLRRYGHVSGNSDWFSFDPYAYRRQNGTSSFDGYQFSAGFKFTDMLKEIFGFDDMVRGYPNQNRQPKAKAQAVAELTISFEEAILGTNKLIQISNYISCEVCFGAGYTRGAKCHACQGAGRVKMQKKIRIKIPPGVEDSHRMLLRGITGNGDSHHRSNDLYVTVKVTPHKFFKRIGQDLLCEVPLDDEQLRRGSRIRVSTIDGRKVDIRIPPGTPKGALLRLPGLGVQDNENTGDQLIKII